MAENMTLAEQITVDPTRGAIVPQCVELIDTQVKAKGGMGGIALRGAYATIKTIKRGFVTDVIEALLDDWVTQLEPYYANWRQGGGATFADYVTTRSDEVSEALLSVTDERAATTKHKTAAKAYNKMRGGAKKHVIEAVPKLGALLENHFKNGA